MAQDDGEQGLGQPAVNALSDTAEVDPPGAPETASDLKGRISAKAQEAKAKAQASSPESFDVGQVGAKARQAADAAQQNPVALAIGAFLLGWLIGRRRGRRSA